MTEGPVDAPSFHSDRIDADRIDELVEILDLQADLPGIRRMRQWAHETLAVRAGERALDIGAGTGSEALVFAERVGDAGAAVGLDPNPAMLAIARRRAAAAGSSARFVHGSVYHLPFQDASFDAVRCERVYQHLDDPAAATAEIVRVLRPGGRVLLIDSDWYTAITHPGDPAVVEALGTAMLADVPNPASGRRLRGLLAAQGLVIDDQGSEAVIWDPVTARPLYQQMNEQASLRGTVTAEEFERFLADLDAGIERGDFHLSVTMFAVLAHKP
ncbi:methyltransferase domain-containing protein [Nocardia amikacinitolerans]|uniref:methyltransferase domain-containing protein n=1 Tax=Nocardia amikacinitolerans TaxID=756689 RepID=UPI000BE3EBBB|nr:methyltransferase domain-containing protein [Nocardia amikacinitolerans]